MTPPTTDDTKAREIHAKLDRLAPYPTEGNVTATGLARYLAKQAQVSWVRGMGSPGCLDRVEVARMVSEFAAAHALLALVDSDPDGADAVAAQIHGAVSDSMSVAVWTIISRFTGVLRGVTVAAVLGAWEDGGGVGEWTWDHLGPDAGEIARLANELAEVSR